MKGVRLLAARVGLVLVFGLGTSELLLRIASAVSPSIDAALGGIPAWQLPDPILGHRMRPGSGGVDARGYRNRSAVQSAAIVALGDSMTFCHSVGIDQAWPERVGALTGLSTYNMGVGGYGPAHYVVLLDEALRLAPKVVLVAIYSGNDAADAYTMVYAQNRVPELRTADVAELTAIDRAERERGPIDRAWRELRERLDLSTPTTQPRSRLVALVKSTWSRLHTRRGPRDWAAERAFAARSDPNAAFAAEIGRVRTVLTVRDHLDLLDAADPRIEAGIEATLGALDRIRARLPKAARLGVVLIPTKELVFAEGMANRSDAPPALGDLARDEIAFWRRIRDEAGRIDADVIDTLPALRGVLARSVNPYREDSDTHPTAAGYEAIAEAVAQSPILSAGSIRDP